MRSNEVTDGMNRVARWLPLLVIAAGVITYANTFLVPFIFDDGGVIVANNSIRPLPLGPRMVVDVTFRLNYAIAKWNVADYHAVNTLIHIVSGLLLFGIVRRTLLLPFMGKKYGESAAWLAASLAVLWVVHPLQTESVTYVCQRYESLMGMFFLMTLYFFARAVAAKRPRLNYDLSILACILGMGSKPVMAGAPILILLYDYMFVASSFGQILRVRWKFYIAICGSWAILFLLQMVAAGDATTVGRGLLADFSSRDYLFAQFAIILHYLKLVVLPDQLCLDYNWQLTAVNMRQVILPGLALAVLALGSIRALICRRPAGYLGAWFFIILAPTSSILPLNDLAFEHRMYLPLAAPLAMLVFVGHSMTSRLRNPTFVRYSIVIAAALALSMMSVARNEDYRSEERMWRDVLQKRPDNVRVRVNLATHLRDMHRYAEAAQHARHILASIPRPVVPHAEGVERYGEFVYLAYGHSENILGIDALERGDQDSAFIHFDNAIAALPGYIAPYANKALAFERKGDYGKVEKLWKQALVISPLNANALNALADISRKRGDFIEAKSYLERVVTAEPDYMVGRLSLAWILATAPDDDVRDGERSVRLATSVCEGIEYRSYRAVDVLAAGHAECGRFIEARRLAVLALDLRNRSRFASHEKRADEIAAIESRIALYMAKKRFRESPDSD